MLPTREQQVYFAEGPGVGQIVHVENGAWLNLLTGQKMVGPYPPPPGSGIVLDDPNQQPPSIRIAKQMSVPHGNSILALGSFTDVIAGVPAIPDAASTLPTPAGLDTTPYTTMLDDPNNYQNPQPDLTANPNLPLQTAVGLIKPNAYINWNVSTGNQGNTMNIPFEESAANVATYTASYWLLSTDGGNSFNYLAYTQNISMQFSIGGLHHNFPHVTSNVVTRQKS